VREQGKQNNAKQSRVQGRVQEGAQNGVVNDLQAFVKKIAQDK
jgi:hypothetical protein